MQGSVLAGMQGKLDRESECCLCCCFNVSGECPMAWSSHIRLIRKRKKKVEKKKTPHRVVFSDISN